MKRAAIIASRILCVPFLIVLLPLLYFAGTLSGFLWGVFLDGLETGLGHFNRYNKQDAKP